MQLNKQSPIPLYYQLAEWIRERIESGELKPGTRLPSERELSKQSGISRMTVRQATNYLVQKGTLIVRPGLGTFVSEPKLTYDALHLLGFTEEIIRQGGIPASHVLEQTVIVPPAHIASLLELAPNDKTLKIVRLRLSQDTPLLLETIYLPYALCQGLERENLSNQSLYALLEQRYGVRLVSSEETLEATVANEYESRLFHIKMGLPMILLEGVTRDERKRPVEYFKAVYRGDRFKFSVASQRNVWTNDLVPAPRLNVVLT
jgi:GntR family transcriptional regulator